MTEILGRLRPPRLATAPASPAVGEMYYDTASSLLFYWNGTAWVSGGGGTTEVWIGPAAPSPREDYTVWVDTDEPDPDPFAVEPMHVVGAAGEPPFAAGWSNFGAGWATCSFYKAQSRVFLQGMIKKSSAVTTGETVFTLPVGYRPPENNLFVVQSNQLVGRVDVYNGGMVAVGVGSNLWLSLDGINFRVP